MSTHWSKALQGAALSGQKFFDTERVTVCPWPFLPILEEGNTISQVESLSQPLPWRVYNFFSTGFKQSISESLLTISAIPINHKFPAIFIMSLNVNIVLSETTAMQYHKGILVPFKSASCPSTCRFQLSSFILLFTWFLHNISTNRPTAL